MPTSAKRSRPNQLALHTRRQASLMQDQVLALGGLKLGKTIQETAEQTGISRATIYRWLKTDPAFLAAYNQWQLEIEEACRARLLLLTQKAAIALEKNLDAGDGKIAVQLLKSLGLMTPAAKPRPTDIDEIRRRADLDEKRRIALLEKDERRVPQDDAKWRYLDDEFNLKLEKFRRKPGDPPRPSDDTFEVSD